GPRLAEARHEVVHPVEAADEGALAAARGTDDRADEVLVNPHRGVLEGRLGAVDRGQVLDVEDLLEPLAWRQRRTLRLDAHGGPAGNRPGHRHSLRGGAHRKARSSWRRLRVASQRAPRLAKRMNRIS